MNIETFYPIYQKANKVTIDSRNISVNDIFFAFSGENFNAATLAEEAIEKGALAVIVEQQAYEDTARNIFYVPSTLDFLQKLAIYHRQQLRIPILGLTGSNGKTTSKELIHAVLESKFKTQYTKGNLNNHIGVPLTILSIDPSFEIAVVEMGANHQKEVEGLCKISQPTIGYITNFGKAHLEGFGGVEGVIKGKSELYDYLKQSEGCILVNTDDPIQIEKTAGYAKTIRFGKGEGSCYVFESFVKNHFVGLKYGNKELISNLTGAYNFTNLCAAVSLGLHFDIEFDAIKKAVENYRPTNMRSQVVDKNGKCLVLDAYNANPSSMSESLKNFSQFEGSKTIIIGDMLELGEASKEEHEYILNQARNSGFTKIITVGPHFKEIHHSELAFGAVSDLIDYLKSHPLEEKNILLKGSRGIQLEKSIDFI